MQKGIEKQIEFLLEAMIKQYYSVLSEVTINCDDKIYLLPLCEYSINIIVTISNTYLAQRVVQSKDPLKTRKNSEKTC